VKKMGKKKKNKKKTWAHLGGRGTEEKFGGGGGGGRTNSRLTNTREHKEIKNGSKQALRIGPFQLAVKW